MPDFPVGAVVNQRVIEWDPRTGEPVVTTVPVVTRAQTHDALHAVLAQTYDADPILEPEFVGRTNLEVMLIRRVRHAAKSGDADEVDALLDRVLGKPKQTSEVRRVELTYEELVNGLARQAKSAEPMIVSTAEPVMEEDLLGSLC